MYSENHVTIISNLNLRVAPMPHNLLVGDQSELVFRLEEQGQTITRVEFLSLLSVNAELEFVDEETRRSVGRKNPLLDASPAEGIYTIPLPRFEKSGPHALTLLIDGKSFTRKYTHDFIIRPQITSEAAVATENNPAVAEVIEPEPERAETENSQLTSPDEPENTNAMETPKPTLSMSVWLVYGLIAAVNLAVFAGAFFAYRYIMNDGKRPVRSESGDQVARHKPQDQKNQETETAFELSTSDAKHKADEAEDEEPPMDDLDSAINELSQFPEFVQKKAASSEQKPEAVPGTERDDLDSMSIDKKVHPNKNTDEKKE